ncbi:MAG: glycerophosphodiester phosphodiesterase [Chloroflexi bacterium]|nr:MAG: glycerophosphodiester phosphodiesterase [Chloroflexota bacterium]HDN80156.1 glycerophosphodiester phosphodiesterase [Chloroflexota bacterium]
MGLQLLAKQGKTLILGHRGARGYAPENTMPSFQKALEMGVDLVELDVRLTRDKQVVVLHDESLKRTTGVAGLVGDFTWEEISHLDAGSWFGPEFAGTHIPLLEEVFRWAKGRVRLVVEIKHEQPDSELLVDKTVELVKRYGLQEEVEIISFDHHLVKRVKELEPGISTGILYVAVLVDPVAAARAAGADAIHPKYTFLNEETVREAHNAGLAVSTWVVNEPEPALKLASWGVDCIGTDYPDRIIKALRENG